MTGKGTNEWKDVMRKGVKSATLHLTPAGCPRKEAATRRPNISLNGSSQRSCNNHRSYSSNSSHGSRNCSSRSSRQRSHSTRNNQSSINHSSLNSWSSSSSMFNLSTRRRNSSCCKLEHIVYGGERDASISVLTIEKGKEERRENGQTGDEVSSKQGRARHDPRHNLPMLC